MINCFQLCSIWSYIKYSNKRRKWQYKNAYGEMQQNKHLMKGSEGRNVFSYILFLKNKVSQFKRPIPIRNRKTQDVQSCNHSEPGAAMHFYLSYSWLLMRKRTSHLTSSCLTLHPCTPKNILPQQTCFQKFTKN